MLELTIPLAESVGDKSLQLVFQRQGDRWAHRFVLDVDGQKFDLLNSVEGDSEQNWPPSPPLQDVSLEELGSTRAIMGVGMAGKSHWSASYSIEDGMFKADVACLVKGSEEPDREQLVSTYRIGDDVKLEQKTESTVTLSVEIEPEKRLDVELVATSKEPVATSLKLVERELQISPTSLTLKKRVATRWGFRCHASC